jgi:hypothetical protein
VATHSRHEELLGLDCDHKKLCNINITSTGFAMIKCRQVIGISIVTNTTQTKPHPRLTSGPFAIRMITRSQSAKVGDF